MLKFCYRSYYRTGVMGYSKSSYSGGDISRSMSMIAMKISHVMQIICTNNILKFHEARHYRTGEIVANLQQSDNLF